MPIIFITLSESYAEKIRKYDFEAKTMKIQDYQPNPNKRTYYVSPANSLCFMDGGIDYALSRIIFPNIEKDVKKVVKELGIESIVGKPYLPIGSSIIIDKDDNTNKKRSLIIAPTMLLPQNVSMTKNAYYATMAILYNILINRKENLNDVDIIMTSLCCGYGKMNEDDSIKQILDAIRDFERYNPLVIDNNIILKEPNLLSQPKYYMNSEFFNINPEDMILA